MSTLPHKTAAASSSSSSDISTSSRTATTASGYTPLPPAGLGAASSGAGGGAMGWSFNGPLKFPPSDGAIRARNEEISERVLRPAQREAEENKAAEERGEVVDKGHRSWRDKIDDLNSKGLFGMGGKA